MNVSSRTLARLSRGYSIAVVPGTEIDGLPSFLAGSEGDGELLLFSPPEFRPTTLAKSPGGFISVCVLTRGARRYAIASTMFKPGFDAAESAIRLYPLDGRECPPDSRVAVLPYAHRIAVLSHGGRDFLLASTLCAAKAHKEDWTQPGGIHLAEIPGVPEQPWSTRPIVTGLNKNHGFEFARLGSEVRPGYLLSAMEGLFFLPQPANPAGPWSTPERLDAAEHSDAFAFDWNDNGRPEIFSISPFHGHVLSWLRPSPSGWRREVIDDDLEFGHIVWAGSFLGQPGLLAGSRRGRRELRLYRRSGDGTVDRRCQIIDEGLGPTQIAVLPCGAGRAVLYVAAHGRDEVRLYDLRA